RLVGAPTPCTDLVSTPATRCPVGNAAASGWPSGSAAVDVSSASSRANRAACASRRSRTAVIGSGPHAAEDRRAGKQAPPQWTPLAPLPVVSVRPLRLDQVG